MKILHRSGRKEKSFNEVNSKRISIFNNSKYYRRNYLDECPLALADLSRKYVDTSAHWLDEVFLPKISFSLRTNEFHQEEFWEDDLVVQVRGSRCQLDGLNRQLEVLVTSIGMTLLHCSLVAALQQHKRAHREEL